jgi:glutamine phosphoribosylpyrophosphate amidotransferase
MANKVDPHKKMSQLELEHSIAQEIGADSVSFQSLEGLSSALGPCARGYCKACLTGQYPTPCGKMRAEEIINK